MGLDDSVANLAPIAIPDIGARASRDDAVEAIRGAAQDLAAVLPTRVEAAVARALASHDAAPVPRQLADLQRSLATIAETVQALSRDLTRERFGRVGDLEVLVDLIASAAESTRGDVQRLTTRIAGLEGRLAEVQDAVAAMVPAVAAVGEKLDRRVRISVQTDPAVAVFGDVPAGSSSSE